jgi:hypothetical protein
MQTTFNRGYLFPRFTTFARVSRRVSGSVQAEVSTPLVAGTYFVMTRCLPPFAISRNERSATLDCQ